MTINPLIALDKRGYRRIADRLKGMYVVGGFHCYPAEIENMIAVHPDLTQIAVIAVQDALHDATNHAMKKRGARSAAFFIATAGSTTARMPATQAAIARARDIVSAASSIMSSCPPTSRCRPSSTRMSRAGIPYFASARFANSRNDE